MSGATLPEGYVRYRHRAYGMDHSWYDWQAAPQRPSVPWPGDKPVALWIVISQEWFPLDMGGGAVRVPGGLDRPYPDFGMYSLRDYGNRVGIFRIMEVLDELGLVASLAVNAAVAERYPVLVSEAESRGWDIVAHGLDMAATHHTGLDTATERTWISTSLEILRSSAASPVTGWLSPGRSESQDTLDLLAEAGLRYVCDWANDEVPYRLHTRQRPLLALPLTNELDDYTILAEFRHSEKAFAAQIRDAYEQLVEEATHSDGRLLSLSLHPWVIGQPHRIGALREALREVAAGGVWSATGAEIADVWDRAQRA